MLPATHRLAANKAIQPQELHRETFIGVAQAAPAGEGCDRRFCEKSRHHAEGFL